MKKFLKEIKIKIVALSYDSSLGLSNLIDFSFYT